MYKPSLEEAKKLKNQGNLLPVYREINADMETPVSAYLKITRGNYSFLLESVEGGERLARYSFLGTEPSKVISTDGGDPLLVIEKEFKKFKPIAVDGLPRFHGGMVGYLSYEVARYFEELPSPAADPLKLPETRMMLADTLLVFDHLAHKIKVVAHAYLDGDIEKSYQEAKEKIDSLVARLKKPLPVEQPVQNNNNNTKETQNLTQAQYEEIVTKMKKHIYEGDIIQGVPSLRLGKPTKASPFAIYRALRSINPSPYMYFLHLDDIYIVGASPELLVRVEDGIVSNHPIAGTRPRGKDNGDDKALEEELKGDEKERAEHVMLVDLARNDVGRISEPGTVEVTQFMDIERYSHVMHIVSHVQGKLREGLTQYDALRACFPAGTVSGAPKIRAMEIIADLEPDKRGPYAGAVGYFDFSGNIDTAIGIRTIIIKDGTAYVQAGAGIVADSIPANEYRECLNKMQATLSAIAQAEGD
ncbi:MAG: anthranilate synthase component I [Dehalococcoidales bacterium]|nr:anthranilate synthase component I [Dehalococcoidales bacterium]